MIKPGEQLPDVTLYEYNNSEGACPIGPNAFSVRERCKQRKVVIFGLPGAFTPTCSERHVPGYVAAAQALFAAGVDEIFCVSVNDAFVMNAWGNSLQVGEAVRMIGDGNGEFSEALGLVQDLSAWGGVRSAMPCWLTMVWSSTLRWRRLASSRSATRQACWPWCRRNVNRIWVEYICTPSRSFYHEGLLISLLTP
jgi:peroxiredoxin